MKRLAIFLFAILYMETAHSFEISYAYASSMSVCSSQNSQALRDEISTLLNSTYKKIVESKKVAFWEMEDRKSRLPHYCYEECACLNRKYSETLQKDFSDKIQVFGMAVRGGEGVLPVEVWDGQYLRSYVFHQVTIIYVNEEKCYFVSDPIIQKDKLISVKEWLASVKSIRKNKIYMWKYNPNGDH